MSLHLNLSTGKFLNSSTLFKLSDALLLDVSSGEIVMSNLLVPRAGVDLSNLASLDLNFAQSKTLTDRVSGNNLITFSRASIGTYVDSDGLIKTTPVNLLTYSQQFDQSSWPTLSGSTTVTPNVATAPDGTNSAYLLTALANTSFNSSLIYQEVLNQSNKDLVGSIYVKSSGSANIARFFVNGNSGSDRQILDVTLTNEWQRVVLPVFNTTQANAFIHVKPGDGDGSIKSLYIWGAQLEEGTTATTYIPTTTAIGGAPRFDHDPVTGESLGLLIEERRTNLLRHSEELSNSYYLKSFVTVTLNQGTAPDGNTTANEILPTTANTFHRITKSGLSISAPCVLSIFVKANGYNHFQIRARGSSSRASVFDLSTGTVTQEMEASVGQTNLGNGITPVDYGNGWWQIGRAHV